MKPFVITPQNKPHAIAHIERLDPTKQWEMIIRERKSKRSLEQNERYWDLLTDLGNYLGYTKDEMHDMMRFKLLRTKVIVEGEALPIMKSTTKLNVAEMTQYMEQIEHWAATIGFVWEEAA